MVGTQVWPDDNRRSAWISILLTMLSVAGLIWMGPSWGGAAAALGAVIAIVDLVHRKMHARGPGVIGGPTAGTPVVLMVLIGMQAVLILIAFGLHHYFLAPLGDARLKIPRFTAVIQDANGQFKVGHPASWRADLLASPHQTGIRFRPEGREAYMGVLEATVLVRPLEKTPASAKEFLERTAQSFRPSAPAKGTLFQFRTESGKLINGGDAVWSELEARKFWLPVRQVTLYGVKDRRYLCSVSATSIASHGTLARLLCLGLFETIRIEKRIQSAP